MSFVINSLRNHFFKHLLCTSAIATTATATSPVLFSHRIRRLSCFSFLFSERPPFFSLSSKTATFSTSPSSSSSFETLASNSYTSPYLSVTIRCHKNVADMLTEALLCFGASSTSIDEHDENEVNNDDEICITSIFSVSQDVKESISLAVDSIGLKGLPSYDVVMHDHTDWIKESQESFHPVEVMEGFWIVPEWEKPPDLHATNIILNPGLAFGTGDHPTTKLCLLLLYGVIKGGELFLDYGTGSGILAIAALKFGAAFSAGLDIEPQAITAAQHNAALNDIQPEKLFLSLVSSTSTSTFTDEISSKDMENKHKYNKGVLTETEKFDVVIANILLNPLLDLAEQIVSHAKPGATVGLSGIISEQVPCIVERYSPFLEGITLSKMDDWVCITGSKKRNPSS
ncbi:hypothetical protein ACH5RR_028103 [Cinchona calisaya]|uniref:ETFB lysine methyltransferase n=1 Tax=Cinchona calisaya TaxID=153742 RepID=A0ABD2YR29_9GENT